MAETLKPPPGRRVAFHTSDVDAERKTGSGLKSIVMWDPPSHVRFANNEPARPFFKSSQINIFNEELRGDGEIDMKKVPAGEEPALVRQRAGAWLARHGDPYALSVLDMDGRVGIDYGVYGVPETYLIDKKGVIRFKQIGPITPEALEQKILPLARQLAGEAS